MKTVVILRTGVCFGGHDPVSINTKVFENMKAAKGHLRKRDYSFRKQPYGSPLWVTEDGKYWAEPVCVKVVGKEKE